MPTNLISQLTHSIQIKKQITVKNAGGGSKPNLQTVYSRRAKVVHKDGTTSTEEVQGHKITAVQDVIVTIRWSPGLVLDASMVIVEEGHSYNIKAIVNESDQNEWIHFNCEEVV